MPPVSIGLSSLMNPFLGVSGVWGLLGGLLTMFALVSTCFSPLIITITVIFLLDYKPFLPWATNLDPESSRERKIQVLDGVFFVYGVEALQ